MAAITWICWIVGTFFAGVGLLWLSLALFRDRSRGRRRCPKCWYDMAGVPGLTCPECGRDGKREARFSRTRRHRWQAVFALVVLSVGFLTTRVPGVMEHGPFDVVPTPVLRIVLGFFADDAEAAYVASNSPGLNSLLSITSGGWPPLPVLPSPPTSPTTWRERIEEDWNNLLVASHVRHLIYAHIRRGRDWNDDPWGTHKIGFVLSGVDDERRIAFDAVRALARRSDVPIEMRRLGVRWLATTGFDAAPTRRTLKSIARSRSAPPSVRLDVIDALQGMNVDSATYIRALRELLVTPDLGSIGLEGYARRAIMYAAKLPTEQAIAELLRAVESERLFTRRVASEGFRQLGAAGSPAIPLLVAAVNRAGSGIEMYAVDSLAAIGGPAAEALARLMRDGDPRQRVYIAVTIRRLNSRDPEVMELIANDLLDSNVPFSRILLGVAQSYGARAVPALEAIPVARQLEPRKRFVMLCASGKLWSNPAVSIAALDDPDREMRRAVFDELRRMKWPADTILVSIVDALVRAKDPRDQRDLISLIRLFEIDDDRVTGLLTGRSGGEGAENLGYNALFTLEVMCDDGELVIDEAIRLLGDPFVHCRILAARLLARAGADAARALPALRAAIKRDDPPLDKPAAEAIETINDAVQEQQRQSSVLSHPIGGP